MRAALSGAGLPDEDLDPGAQEFLVVRDGGVFVGMIGLEVFGEAGLLRSLWVDPARRGEGIAALLCLRLCSLARSRAVAELWLLTTTARDFFDHSGFRVVDRDAAPAEVKESAQFRALCPSTATCMVQSLVD